VANTGNWRSDKTITTFSGLCYALQMRCEKFLLDMEPELQKTLTECIQEEIYNRPETIDPRTGEPYYKRTEGLLESTKVKIFVRKQRAKFSSSVGIEVYHEDIPSWDSEPEEFEHGSKFSDPEDSRAMLDTILNDGRQGKIFDYGGGFGARPYIDAFEEKVMTDGRILDQLEKNLNF